MSLRKSIILSLVVFTLAWGIFARNMPLTYASPKSLYLVANHHTSQFDAWNINPDGTATYQATYWLSYATDPAGIAMDESSNTLFITSEFSGGVEMVDATTMTPIDVSAGPSNLAGIDVDDANDIVYAAQRNTNNLYAYSWDPIAQTLTPKPGFNPFSLPGTSGAFGIALDTKANILWVADTAAGIARAYDTNTWTEDVSKSFAPSHQPVDIAVDRQRGYVYTVSMEGYGSWVPGPGSDLLSKYDLATGIETTVNMGHEGVGVAVDEVTGFVYVTGGIGTGGDNLEVWDTSTSPWTQVQATPDLGNPAGICIPREEVAYNPLNLEKVGPVSANPGDTITYTITFNNSDNASPVNNVVLVDDLPPETTFVSATGGGIYAGGPHTVTWNIGTLTAGAPTQTVSVTVTINPGTTQGSIITNFATIDSDETPATTVFWDTYIPIVGVIPEVPMGTIMASAAMIIALIAYVAKPKWKRKPI